MIPISFYGFIIKLNLQQHTGFKINYLQTIMTESDQLYTFKNTNFYLAFKLDNENGSIFNK